jgi:hypothetical protein
VRGHPHHCRLSSAGMNSSRDRSYEVAVIHCSGVVGTTWVSLTIVIPVALLSSSNFLKNGIVALLLLFSNQCSIIV